MKHSFVAIRLSFITGRFNVNREFENFVNVNGQNAQNGILKNSHPRLASSMLIYSPTHTLKCVFSILFCQHFR